ncbi:hypothetical protein [Edaphobacter sp.]|uniref:hypothetical protein n=1 Tax=Edaphobacter sp. TaxID=1934404 RepID=UPI002DBCC7E5|nr:hypothetical protein [Edaphobacter sp.]HEU5342106.1 hypothetical protein [Edaphobacter sp.]
MPDDRLSEAEVVMMYESEQARRTRGGCTNCGHTWRPRNPSQRVKRCPGCGLRSHVSYTVYSDKPE